MYRDFEPHPHLNFLLSLVYSHAQGLPDTLATAIVRFSALDQISLRHRPRIVRSGPQIGPLKSNSFDYLQIKFHKLNGSHIAKSTKNHSLPRLRHFAASCPGSTIADRGNPRSLATLAVVPVSSPVSYLDSPDLNLACEAPGRMTPGCSQTRVSSRGMYLDSAGSALNAGRDG